MWYYEKNFHCVSLRRQSESPKNNSDWVEFVLGVYMSNQTKWTKNQMNSMNARCSIVYFSIETQSNVLFFCELNCWNNWTKSNSILLVSLTGGLQTQLMLSKPLKHIPSVSCSLNTNYNWRAIKSLKYIPFLFFKLLQRCRAGKPLKYMTHEALTNWPKTLVNCLLAKQLVHNFTVVHSSILFDCISWHLPLSSMTHRNYHNQPLINGINRKMPKNMKDVKKSMFGCTHFEVAAREQKICISHFTFLWKGDLLAILLFTLAILLTFSKSCVSDMLQITVISVFCFAWQLTFIFSWFYIRFYQDHAQSEVSSTLTAIVALAITLLTTALVPIDIFIVSYMKNDDGTWKVSMAKFCL